MLSTQEERSTERLSRKARRPGGRLRELHVDSPSLCGALASGGCPAFVDFFFLESYCQVFFRGGRGGKMCTILVLCCGVDAFFVKIQSQFKRHCKISITLARFTRESSVGPRFGDSGLRRSHRQR